MRTLDIAFNLYSHYGKVEEINNYYGLLALYGLVQAGFESNDTGHLERCRTLLVRYPEGIRHPYYNFPCYRLGGNAAAWAAMKGMGIPSEEQLIDFAEQTIAGPKEAAGILCMPGRAKEGWIWIDVVAAVTPFLLFAGLACGREDFIEFGAAQCFLMYEALLDKSCGLVHQSRGFLEDTSLCSEDHWSRGNGWCYMGLTELVAFLPEDSVHRKKALEYYCNLSAALVKYQTPRGLWRQEMTESLSWEESSGTALFLYGLGMGLRTGILDREVYGQVYRQGMSGLLRYCINDDFSTELSCPGCLCPGEGAQKGTIQAYITEKLPVRDEHHSFGAFMLALVEAHRNGIEEIDWKNRSFQPKGLLSIAQPGGAGEGRLCEALPMGRQTR